ncbi:MAG: two-component regulator propeller domain-containing protein, partial [Bacteroidota bacterium]
YQFADPKRSFINDLSFLSDRSIWAASRKGFSVLRGEQWQYVVSPSSAKSNQDQQVHTIVRVGEQDLYFNYQEGVWRINGTSLQADSLGLAAFVGLGSSWDKQLIYLSSAVDSPYESINFKMKSYPETQAPLLLKSVLAQNIGRTRTRFRFLAIGPNESWATTGEEVYHIQGKELEVYGRSDGLPSDFVNDLVQDKQGTIWVATEKGIASYTAKQSWQIFAPLDKIACRRLVFDPQGHLWIGTQQGLYRWDGLVLERFDSQMGLVSNDINALALDQEQRLWIGTSRGISSLDLKKMIDSGEAPTLIMQSVILDGQSIPVDSVPNIESSQNLTWQYAGLYYANPQEIAYRYRFLAQEDWQYTLEDKISASQLNAGSYQLQI